MSARKLAAYRRGLRAETLAAWWLRLKFYRILARNFSGGGAEVDLIAQRGAVLAFVEVKARNRRDEALLAIDARKAARISRAARAFVAMHPGLSGCVLRGDAMLMAPWRAPRHIAAAFEIAIWL